MRSARGLGKSKVLLRRGRIALSWGGLSRVGRSGVRRSTGRVSSPRTLRPHSAGFVVLLVFAASLSLAPAVEAATLPDNFVEETMVANLNGPVAMKWMPDGRLLVTEQDGIVKIADPGSGQPAQVVLDISAEVNNWNDRGLLGLELHPNFPTTPEMFLLYTYDPPETQNAAGLYDGDDGPDRQVEHGEPDAQGQRVSRLVRWDLDAGSNFTSVVAGSDVVLLGQNSTWDNIGDPFNYGQDINSRWSCAEYDQPGDPNTSGTPIEDCLPADVLHGIGTLRFAPDGMLFAGMGDGATPDEIDPRALRAQDIDTLAGKILRIDPSNGRGLADNPFYDNDASSNRSRVYQFGLRNPFRFTVDPASGEPIIGDVGWNSFEEINIGSAGADFGWPCFEGGLSDATMAAGQLEGPGVNRLGPGYSQLPGCADDIAANTATPPIWSWCHSDAHPSCTQGVASSYAGAVTVGTNYPPQFRGLWFGDLYGVMQVMDLASGQVTGVSPDIGFPVDMSLGPDGNIYYISAAASSVMRLVYVDPSVVTQCRGVAVTVYVAAGDSPTNGDDVILGTEADESINGLAGDDLICGGGGDDIIDGGAGSDDLNGDDGNDTISGGTEADIIRGGTGDDTLDGGTGDDNIRGEAGNDDLSGGAGNDLLFGDDGDDTLSGEEGLDYLEGGSGIDAFSGGPDRDHLEGAFEGEIMNGDAGDDIILGYGGADTLNGGPGSDYLWGGGGTDVFNGGDGVDHLEGGGEGETMNGDAGDDIILGYGGADTLNGGPDSDYLWGGDGVDVFNGGDGVDHLQGGVEGETMDGGAGNDVVLGFEGSDTLIGGIGSDYLWGSTGDDTLDGGDGDDYLDGGDGDDQMDGGAGNDSILAFDGDDELQGSAGEDYLWGGLGVDTYDGGAGADYLDGGAEGELMNGGSDDDIILGREGDDSLFGGPGAADYCSPGSGDDFVDDSCEIIAP